MRSFIFGIVILGLAPILGSVPPRDSSADPFVFIRDAGPSLAPSSRGQYFIGMSPADETVVRDQGAYFRIRVVGPDPSIRARILDVKRARFRSGTPLAPHALRSRMWPPEKPLLPLPPLC